jgi:hypothetical protein
VTFILEAFSKSVSDAYHTQTEATKGTFQGHIICEVSTFTQMRAQLGMASWWDVSDTNFIVFRKSSKKPSFAHVSRLMAPLHTRPLAIQLVEWLDAIISEPDAVEYLVGNDPLNLDDLRVREYTEDEVRPNRKYMGMGLDLLKLKAFTKVASIPCLPSNFATERRICVKNIDGTRSHGTSTIGLEPKTQAPQVAYEEIVASLEKRRSAIKPQWWTDWENGVVRSN